MAGLLRQAEQQEVEISRLNLLDLPQELFDMIIKHAYNRRSAELRLIIKTSWDKRERIRAGEGRQAPPFPGSVVSMLLVCKVFFKAAALIYIGSGPMHLQYAFHVRHLAHGTGVIGAYAKDVIAYFSDWLYFPPMLKMESLELVARGRLLIFKPRAWGATFDRQALEDAWRLSDSLHGIEPHVRLRLRGHSYHFFQHINTGPMHANLQTLESILRDRIKSGRSKRSYWGPIFDLATHEPTQLYPGSRVGMAVSSSQIEGIPGIVSNASSAQKSSRDRGNDEGSKVSNARLFGQREGGGIKVRLPQWTEAMFIQSKACAAGKSESSGNKSVEMGSLQPTQELSFSGIFTVETKPLVVKTEGTPAAGGSRRLSFSNRIPTHTSTPHSTINKPDSAHSMGADAEILKAQVSGNPNKPSLALDLFELLAAQGHGDAAALARIEEQQKSLNQQLIQEINAMVWSVADKTMLAMGVLMLVFLLHCSMDHVFAPGVEYLRSSGAELIHQWAYGL